jgi:hypothetical protein
MEKSYRPQCKKTLAILSAQGASAQGAVPLLRAAQKVADAARAAGCGRRIFAIGRGSME